MNFKSRLRIPNAANSFEEWQQVYHLDLAELSLYEIVAEEWWAARLAERYPDRIVWRGMCKMTVREWASERVELCERLRRDLTGATRSDSLKQKPRAKPWAL